MTKLIPCTVQLLTRNSVGLLRTCLETLTEFAEVIVQDGYSTDGTREMVAEFPNARILDQDKRFLDADGRITHFANMRNESIRAAKYDWLIVVDADEKVQSDMVSEVRGIVERNVPGVYQAFRRFYVDGQKVIHCSGYPALQIRLFHRSLTDGYAKAVHEKIQLHPGVTMQLLANELPVPLPPAHTLNAKYDRYLRMDVLRTGKLSFGQWVNQILLRNLRSILGLSYRLAKIWLVPRTGKRMPIAYELQQMRYSWRVIWALCPGLRKAS